MAPTAPPRHSDAVHAPTPNEVRALLAPFDALDRRVTGGVITLLMRDPEKVRDQEWLAERFVEVAVVAHGFPEDGSATTDDVEVVRLYAEARRRAILNAAIALFVRAAVELSEAGGTPTHERAHAVIRTYLGSD